MCWIFENGKDPFDDRYSHLRIKRRVRTLDVVLRSCPSVPVAVRKLWVKHGGTLTHTDIDFRNAEFFFCDGMNDPWLKQLLARSLIVRHAAWVTLCVMENFCMPIADYTLDGVFEESKIVIHKPLRTVEEVKPVAVTRKRPFDHEETSHNLRRHKKPRIQNLSSSVSEPRTKVTKAVTSTASENKDADILTLKDSSATDDPLQRISFVPKGSKISSQNIKLFERRIVPQPQTLASPTTPDNKSKMDGVLPRYTLNPHTSFWNDLLAKSFVQTREANKVLTLKIDDLLTAPGIQAAIFTVNETFLGKRFINREYDYN